MKSDILPVTQENWRQVIQLSVTPEQEPFIESNAISLLESRYDSQFNWKPFALVVENQIIGFAMVGAYHQEDHYIWLDRLMIDQQFQGQGYGNHFLHELLIWIKKKQQIDKVILSTHPKNQAALVFYERKGFVNTKQFDPENGEVILVYTYKTK